MTKILIFITFLVSIKNQEFPICDWHQIKKKIMLSHRIAISLCWCNSFGSFYLFSKAEIINIKPIDPHNHSFDRYLFNFTIIFTICEYFLMIYSTQFSYFIWDSIVFYSGFIELWSILALSFAVIQDRQPIKRVGVSWLHNSRVTI